MSWLDIDLSTVDTPALIIDEALVISNIETAISHAGGLDRLRPHVKTHKTLEVAQLQLRAGIRKFKCATIPEAEMLGMAGADDVLIAYQPQGPKISRVRDLIEKYPNTLYSVLIDNVSTAKMMNQVFSGANDALRVYIDINDGHFRTGIIPTLVPGLVESLISMQRISLVGLHCYDGHIRMPDLKDRITCSTSAYKDVIDLKEALDKKYGLSLNMVAGGTPSFTAHARYHDVECSPGTWIFWDERYATEYKEQAFEKAAVVATRVISKLDNHRYCLDLGHKSIASEMPLPRVKFLNDLEIEQTGHSEEHLTVNCTAPDALEVGDLLLAYPYHICPTVALYDQLQVVRDGVISDQWKVIARDRKITI